LIRADREKLFRYKADNEDNEGHIEFNKRQLQEQSLMNATLKTRVYSQPRTELRLCEDTKPEEQAAFWRINGYRARLILWTPDEWQRLETPPADAQLHPLGIWCALRVD
jgi:hypothetical protein